MTTYEFTLQNGSGLHARPASLFVKEASKYVSMIKIMKAGVEFDAKSIMGILSMGAGKGDELTITAEGEDEKDAIEGLKKVIEEL